MSYKVVLKMSFRHVYCLDTLHMNLKNRLIIGPYEEVEYTVKKDLHSKTSLENIEVSSIEKNKDTQKKCQKNKFNILLKSFETYNYLINVLKARSRHASCPHPYSCAHYVLAVRITI